MTYPQKILVASMLMLGASGALAGPTVHHQRGTRVEVEAVFAQYDRPGDVPIIVRHVSGPIPEQVRICVRRSCQTYQEVPRLTEPRLMWLPASNLHAPMMIDGRHTGVVLSGEQTMHTNLHIVGTIGAEPSQFAEHVFNNNDPSHRGLPHEFDQGIKAVDASAVEQYPSVVHQYAAMVVGKMPSERVIAELREFVKEGGTVSARAELSRAMFGDMAQGNVIPLTPPYQDFDTRSVWKRHSVRASSADVGFGQVLTLNDDASDEALHLALVTPQLKFRYAKKQQGYEQLAVNLAHRELGSPVPYGAMVLFVLVAAGLGFGLFVWRRKNPKALLRTLAIFSASTTAFGLALSVACNATADESSAHYIVIDEGRASAYTAHSKRPGGGYLFNDTVTLKSERLAASEFGIGWGTNEGAFTLDEHKSELKSDLSGVMTRTERRRSAFSGTWERAGDRVVLKDLGFEPMVLVVDDRWAELKNGEGVLTDRAWEARVSNRRVQRTVDDHRYRANRGLAIGLNAQNEIVVMEWK